MRVTASLKNQIIKKINEDGSILLGTPNYTLFFYHFVSVNAYLTMLDRQIIIIHLRSALNNTFFNQSKVHEVAGKNKL